MFVRRLTALGRRIRYFLEPSSSRQRSFSEPCVSARVREMERLPKSSGDCPEAIHHVHFGSTKTSLLSGSHRRTDRMHENGSRRDECASLTSNEVTRGDNGTMLDAVSSIELAETSQ